MEWKRKFLDIRKRQPTGTNNHDSQITDHPPSTDGQTSVTEDTLSLKQTDEWSSNLPPEQLEASKGASKSENVIEIHEDIDDDSPYEEVRAAVRNTDDNSPANTVRAWILGMIFVTVVAAINMLLSMRSPALTVPTVVVILLVYPLGLLWAKFVPTKTFRTFGVEWTTNPGPWTIKEHTVVTLMANVTSGYPYSTNALEALQAKPLYNHNMGWGTLPLSYSLSVTD
jgi:hypothetical protein